MILSVFAGADFAFAGAVQLDGIEQSTEGWVIVANLYDKSGTTLISALPINWIDQTKGLFNIAIPGSQTSAWPAGLARIDMQVSTDTGQIILSPPAYLRIQQSPLS